MRGERRRPTPHLGALQHERNRYKTQPPDFYALGQQYPEFKQYLRNVDDENRRASLPWDDPFAVRELTKTLLLNDFGLQWDIPISRLCPPLPNRLNYLHWIEDLLDQVDAASFQAHDEQSAENKTDVPETIAGIDVGTGANCIYALLGAAMNKWRFLATEIDEESYQCAKKNVARNHLDGIITVKRTHTNKLLTEPLQDEAPERKFHFVMCNPPFFDNMSEADTNPQTSCMGSANEMVFPGGEVAFIGGMIAESVELQNRVLWFTSMVGRKASLRKLLALLREKNVQTTRTTEFFQGRTKRWGIAWTFWPNVASDPSAKILGKRKEAHRRQEMSFEVPLLNQEAVNGCSTMNEVMDRVREFVNARPGVEISSDKAGQNGGEDGCLRFQLKQQAVCGSTSESGAVTADFVGWLEISPQDDSEGFEVLLRFEDGHRASFWTMADMVKAATIRTGRQWRRKVQRQQNGS